MNLTLLEKGLDLVLYLLCSNKKSAQKGGWIAVGIGDTGSEVYLEGHGLAFIFTHIEMISWLMNEGGFHLLGGKKKSFFPQKESGRNSLFFLCLLTFLEERCGRELLLEEITDILERQKLPEGVSWEEVAMAIPRTIKGKIGFIQERRGEKAAAWFREHVLLSKKEKNMVLSVNKRLFGKEITPEIYFPGDWPTFNCKIGEVLIRGNYLGSGLSQEEIRDSVLAEALRPYLKNASFLLAQMCIWAVKRGVADYSIYNYLLGYIQKRLRINDRNTVADICNYVVENYTVPLRKGGFHAYLRECAKNYRKNCREMPVEDIKVCIGKRKKHSVTEGTKTTDEVALEVGCPRRWLYKQIEKGKVVPQVINSRVLTNQDYVEKKRYLFTQECINQIRQLWSEKNRREELARLKKEMAAEKGISLRSVQRWYRRMEQESMSKGGLTWQ